MSVITIQSGDTLSGLALQHKTTVGEIVKLNPQIQDPNLIFAGANLTLPDKHQDITPSTASPAPSSQAQVTGETTVTPSTTISPPEIIAETKPALDRSTVLTTFNKSLVEMLEQFQGLDSLALENKKTALRKEREGRISDITDEELQILSPAAQDRIRQARAQAVTPSITNISELQNSMASFERLLNTAGLFGERFVKSLPTPPEILEAYAAAVERGENLTTVPERIRGQVLLQVDPTKVKAGGQFNPQQVFQNTLAMRKEFDDQSKDFIVIRDAFARIQVSAKSPAGPGDLALIFSFMKVLDPGSVVRESEFATAQDAASFMERIYGKSARFTTGGRLSDQTRLDFLKTAGGLFDAQLIQQNRLREEFRGTASSFGLDPLQIAPDLTAGLSADKNINIKSKSEIISAADSFPLPPRELVEGWMDQLSPDEILVQAIVDIPEINMSAGDVAGIPEGDYDPNKFILLLLK